MWKILVPNWINVNCCTEKTIKVGSNFSTEISSFQEPNLAYVTVFATNSYFKLILDPQNGKKKQELSFFGIFGPFAYNMAVLLFLNHVELLKTLILSPYSTS